MAPRFLCKTALAPARFLQVEGALALDSYPRMRAGIAAAFGAGAAELFAEPIVTWATNRDEETTVAWYSELSGNATPLVSLQPERRGIVEQRLRQALERLRPLLTDSALAPVVQRALSIRSLESVWVVGDQPVLTEWGVLPDGVEPSADPQAALARSPLAGYLVAPAQPAPAPPPTATAASMAATRPIGAAPPLPNPLGPAGPRWRAPWFVVPAALAIAALFLVLGYWRGSILAAERAEERNPIVTVIDEDRAKQALEQQNALNAGLEREIEERRRLLAGNVCMADPGSTPRLGPDRAALPAPSVVPPPPGGQPFQGTLADLLKQAIVMVLASGPDQQLSLGTGFFITPELIVTNRHVIEQTVDGKVAVVNLKLGHPIMAEVVATTPTSNIGSLDLALLRVPPPGGVQPLAFSAAAAELDTVIAAGYPGLITGADGALRRLLVDGDMSAAPQLIMTDGRIQAIQTSQDGVKIMPHGAAVSGGNSGGPLVDSCGRVVGIVTFIRADAASAAHANFALKTDSLLPFLHDHGAAVTESNGPCAPGTPAAPTTPSAPPAAAASPSNADPASRPTTPAAEAPAH